ncbi:MAG: hypothetical protein K0Q53_1490 [Massilibacillus sp.]|jgi:hypothetical protein|nr:hypothetical protein [Massilibacillus sp.]
MRKLVWAIFLMGALLIPRQCLAMNFDVHFETIEDNFIGELWCDQTLFWRFAISPTEAVPVSTSAAKFHTLLTPEVEDGFFIFRVQ